MIEDADVLGRFRFRCEIDMVAWAGFKAVEGLGYELSVEEYEEGGQNFFVHQLPRRIKWKPIVLTKGIVRGDSSLWQWVAERFELENVIYPTENQWLEALVQFMSPLFRRNMSITAHDAQGEVAVRWLVFGAIVKEHDVEGGFDALTGDILMERLTIRHHGFERVAKDMYWKF